MAKILKYTLLLLLFVGVFLAGVFVTRSWTSRWETNTEESATVLLEKIETVAKLVTVEGYFSELYNYKDYWGYDWPIFRKKAILRVQARVSVGFDLSNLQMDLQPDERILTIRNIPEAPEILSIEHDIDYYDLSEGTFNAFDEADYTKLNKDARDFIREKAKEGDLMDKAREQGIQVLDVIRFMAENAGYTVYLESEKGPLQPEQLKK